MDYERNYTLAMPDMFTFGIFSKTFFRKRKEVFLARIFTGFIKMEVTNIVLEWLHAFS